MTNEQRAALRATLDELKEGYLEHVRTHGETTLGSEAVLQQAHDLLDALDASEAYVEQLKEANVDLIAREAQATQRAEQAKLLKHPSIATRCPSCHNDTLFIGENGWLICSWLKCKNPTALNEDKRVEQAEARVRELEASSESREQRVATLTEAALECVVHIQALRLASPEPEEWARASQEVDEAGLRLQQALNQGMDISDARNKLERRVAVLMEIIQDGLSRGIFDERWMNKAQQALDAALC